MKNQSLNRGLAAPLYVQLKEVLLGKIRSEELKPGDMIQTEFELMDSYGVSRNVVRQAIGELVEEGYLIRKRAKGTFVSTTSANVEQLVKLDAFRETVIRSGAIPVTKVLSMEVLDADAAIAGLLGVAEETRVIRIRRLRYSDDQPVTISTSYMPYAKCAFVLEHRLQNDSLYRVLGQHYDTRVYRSTRRFEARRAENEEAAFLQIEPGGMVQCMLRQSYSRTNAVIEVTLSVYRGDFEFSFETVEHT